MMTCSRLYITKIKCSKILQSQRTEEEIKTSFNFTEILIKYVWKTQNLTLYPSPSYNEAQQSNNKSQFIYIYIYIYI